MIKPRKAPERKCIACHQMKVKRELIRVVRKPEGEVELDITGKLAGRGAYICKHDACFEKARKSNAFGRALNHAVSDEVYDKLKFQLGRIAANIEKE